MQIHTTTIYNKKQTYKQINKQATHSILSVTRNKMSPLFHAAHALDKGGVNYNTKTFLLNIICLTLDSGSGNVYHGGYMTYTVALL